MQTAMRKQQTAARQASTTRSVPRRSRAVVAVRAAAGDPLLLRVARGEGVRVVLACVCASLWHWLAFGQRDGVLNRSFGLTREQTIASVQC